MPSSVWFGQTCRAKNRLPAISLTVSSLIPKNNWWQPPGTTLKYLHCGKTIHSSVCVLEGRIVHCLFMPFDKPRLIEELSLKLYILQVPQESSSTTDFQFHGTGFPVMGTAILCQLTSCVTEIEISICEWNSIPVQKSETLWLPYLPQLRI